MDASHVGRSSSRSGYRRSPQLLVATLCIVLLVLAPACSDGTGDPQTTDATTTLGATGTTAASPTAAATTPPADAAPAALQGSWRTTLDEDSGSQTVTIQLLQTSYRITRAGNQGAGSISVSGDQIEFFGSTLCEGSGTYEWSVEGDTLQLTPVDDDPCPGRYEVIIGYTYTRV